MKFSHGVWKWADGIVPLCVRRVTEYRVDRDALWVAAVDRDGPDPSDRFEGLVLQLHITSPMPDVIRVRIVRKSASDASGSAHTVLAPRRQRQLLKVQKHHNMLMLRLI